MNESSNTLEDLLSEQQLKEYRSKEYPFNTNFLGQILKEKLKEDPAYEVWAPFFFCRYMALRRNKDTPSVIHSPLLFISNKGKVVKFNKGEYHPLAIATYQEKYPVIVATFGYKETYTLVLHRALASVFIPLPPELKLFHPKDLEVNHIDGDKANFELDNLEWSTHSRNQLHAAENGLFKSGKDSTFTKPVKGRIEFGLHSGHEFILHGLADYKKYKFTQSNIVACCKGRVKTHKKCSWSYATELELTQLPSGLTEAMVNDLG